ncbi:hypothetical protein GOP47_0000849 [Adiantum capillus-veneris]|uniref:Protein ENHANCED DISEASE RESISTANCE 2 C-terminal domain-containing protein n=1 Tax=Adiantum capillus-veneris TaxID=13818 RepID=A0A9D4VEQ9_ADICA|nr:hypothetical protein GOP47_0000849 [Adiantum capillus-veneris]
MAEQSSPDHEELPEWVKRLRHGGPIPLSDSSSRQGAAAECSWACLPGKLFHVRGADYERSKMKVAGGACLLQPLAVDFFQGPCKIASVMERPDCRVRAALADIAAAEAGGVPPFVWVFNYQLSTSANHSLVLYFVSSEPPPEGSMLQKFLDGDDAFRKARLKTLVRMPEAPRVVQALVGARWPACVVGNFLKCSYTRTEKYLEVDVDLGSSPLIGAAVHCTFGLARLVVVDLAFVLEGIYSDELPEEILGAFRLHKLDPSSALYIDDRCTSSSTSLPSSAASNVPPLPSVCVTSAADKPASQCLGGTGLKGGLLRLLGKKGQGGR